MKLKQRFCKHNYKKRYSKKEKGYVYRCTKCNKVIKKVVKAVKILASQLQQIKTFTNGSSLDMSAATADLDNQSIWTVKKLNRTFD